MDIIKKKQIYTFHLCQICSFHCHQDEKSLMNLNAEAFFSYGMTQLSSNKCADERLLHIPHLFHLNSGSSSLGESCELVIRSIFSFTHEFVKKNKKNTLPGRKQGSTVKKFSREGREGLKKLDKINIPFAGVR